MRAHIIAAVFLATGAASAWASGGPSVETIEERLGETSQGAVQPGGGSSRAGVDGAAPSVGETDRALEGGLLLQTPSSFVFYSAADARDHLARIGAPVPRGAVLGMLAPLGKQPTDADFWGAVISFDAIGTVPETGAERVSAAGFLAEVRRARGPDAPPIEAFEPWPRYDAERDHLVWAERKAGEPAGARSVLYAHRLLGREGVAAMDIHLRPDQLGEALAVGPTLAQLITFVEGRRLADAGPQDRRSIYDVPGLITGRPAPTAAAAPSGAQAFLQTLPGGPTPWIAGAALAVAAAAGGAFLALSRRRKRFDDNLMPR